ncbi:MAG: universal stress protein [Gemmatimonadota bacterium]
MKDNLIMVAVDSSEECVPAYRAALRLCDQLGARLCLLHVVERHDLAHVKRAAAWLERHGLTDNDVRTVPGTAWVQIVRQVEDLEPVLLVVGSHGVGGYQPITPGSTAALLIVRSPTPVLVVPSRPASIGRRLTQTTVNPNHGSDDA